jgi:hypothetical protein
MEALRHSLNGKGMRAPALGAFSGQQAAIEAV